MDIYEDESALLKAIAHSSRLAILDVLRNGEQCVCHMEAVLNLRQAYISQQLMILKNAGLIASRRDGLNLYYRVIKPEIYNVLDVLQSAMGITKKSIQNKHKSTSCSCPKCSPKAEKPLIQITNP